MRRYALKSLKEPGARQRSQNHEREAAGASGDAVPDTIDIERLDLQKISAQTKALETARSVLNNIPGHQPFNRPAIAGAPAASA